MRRTIWVLTVAVLIFSVSCGVGGYFVTIVYVQGLLAGAATNFLSLAVALLAVNYYLTRSDKAEAAAPLVKLIDPAITELHNELFVNHWNSEFGIDEGESLLDIYRKNRKNPKAYSPEQRDRICAAILKRASDLLRVYDVLVDQFRELSMITGWSFDPTVTAAALEARLNFIKFKSIHTSSEPEIKYQIIEAYLDGEAAATAVYEKLRARLGQPRSAWTRSA